MLYGALFVAIYAIINREPFIFDPSLPYVVSLVYLSLFGSVLAFGAYLLLMARVGAHAGVRAPSQVPLGFRAGNLHLFDAESGARLGA